MDKKTQLTICIKQAKAYENRMNKPCYIEWSVPMNGYLTTTKMPMIGEWYTSDGIRHG